MNRPPLGQHFLRDPRVTQTILAAAELQPNETALEIGPGKGALTDPLSERVSHLVAVEIDQRWAETLVKRYAERPHIGIVHSDFLSVELDSLFPPQVQPVKVLGNLPYSVTSPILEKLLEWSGWNTAVFLVQKEVADRMQASEGSKTFGILSLAVQLFAQVEPILSVKPGAFIPPPRVSSRVVRLRRKMQAMLPSNDIPAFFDLAHGAFAHRRKTLANSLALFTDFSKEVIVQWLTAQGINPAARAESLALEEYVRIANAWAIFRREINLT